MYGKGGGIINKEKIQKFMKFIDELNNSWQIYSFLIGYLLIIVITTFVSWKLALLLAVFLIILITFVIYNSTKLLKGINVTASKLVKDIREANDDLYKDSPMGIIIYDENQRIMWGNRSAVQILNNKDAIGENLQSINPIFSKIFESRNDWIELMIDDHMYKILHLEDKKTIYFMDVNEEYHIRELRKHDKLVFGYLQLDDYDDVMQSMNDQEISNLDAELVTKLNEWASQNSIYIKRIEEDKFILLLNNKVLENLESGKFTFFKNIRQDYYSRNIPISISVGLSYPTEEYYQISNLAKEAQKNLDLALGRGGDQVVIRSGDEQTRFYGGDTNPSEKRTNTRAKLVYQSLINQIDQASNIIITGHKYPDLDSIASALGIYKIATEQRKMAKIIVNEQTFNTDIQQLLNSPQINYNLKNIFSDVESAKEYLTPKTLIIMVDHHRPSLSEAEDLLYLGQNILIIDHHRRGEEFPEKTVLTYIEPNASSTSELITEFFMLQRNAGEPINRFEATALLAGIIVDTNNFAMRTGSRTFDSASYLKSRGADTEQIQRLLKEDLKKIKKRNRLIEHTEFYFEIYAITAGNNEEQYDNITAAQAADSILSLKNAEASFVIYRRKDQAVGISARSMGKINVQKIMEIMGGGGHLSNAATQLENISVNEAKEQLITAIKQTL